MRCMAVANRMLCLCLLDPMLGDLAQVRTSVVNDDGLTSAWVSDLMTMGWKSGPGQGLV